MNEEQQILYLAGFVDGEGSFWRGRSKNGRGETHYDSRLIIAQINDEVISWLKECFGGYARQITPKNPKWNKYWRWEIRGKKAEALALRLQPYLMVKREQVKRVIKPYATSVSNAEGL